MQETIAMRRPWRLACGEGVACVLQADHQCFQSMGLCPFIARYGFIIPLAVLVLGAMCFALTLTLETPCEGGVGSLPRESFRFFLLIGGLLALGLSVAHLCLDIHCGSGWIGTRESRASMIVSMVFLTAIACRVRRDTSV